jgi:peptidyl-prolyl cis-trans isomerase C
VPADVAVFLPEQRSELMLSGRVTRLAALLLVLAGGPVFAQGVAPPPPPLPPAGAVAATVNAQNIPELAVYRGLLPVPEDQRAKARKEILNFLIETALIDQYLEQLKVMVDPAVVDARFKEVQSLLNKKDPKGFEGMLKTLALTEAEVRTQIGNELRFEKFVEQQGTDKNLRAFFDSNRAMFDGTMMRARHILLSPPEGDAAAAAQARAKLLAMKKQIEEKAAQEAARAGPGADNLAREKARMKALDDAFADLAARESACPSKKEGGSLPWFPRIGRGAMVEPFARVAFALKPYQLSDVVATQFGLHLILAVDVKPGKEVKYEDVRDFVREVYADRLREAIIARMRPTAQIVINPPAAKQ